MAKEDQDFPYPPFRSRKRLFLYLIMIVVFTIGIAYWFSWGPFLFTLAPIYTPTFTPSPTLTPSLTPSPSLQFHGTYTIQQGDTFAMIAKRYSITVSELWAANPGIWDINQIYPGQVINVPQRGYSIPPSSETPNPTQIFQAAKKEVKEQYKTANISYRSPRSMRKGTTTHVELLLNRVLSETALATMEVERSGFPTSTAEPGVLIGTSGEEISITTGNIKITDRMKVVLYSDDPKAFEVQAMSQEEQVIGLDTTAIWRWSVTALEEGPQTLELVIYWLIQDEGEDYWTEVESFRDTIVVEVTTIDRIKSWDWKWIIGTILAVIGTLIAISKWIDSRKKKTPENNQSYTPE